MKLKETVKLISLLKEEANKFIINELEKNKVVGIVPSHGSILMTLYTYKSMTMKEIADEIKRKQPTVTVLVEKLIEHGYVEKKKNLTDSRSSIISLTKKGETFRSLFIEISGKLNRKMHAGLSEHDVEILEKLLTRMSKNW